MELIERLRTVLEGLYEIERKIAEGGMATVFLARDVKHKRQVALKVLKPELAAVVGGERFLAEIQTTAHLQHPHILPLFDSGEADGFLYYVMPYVEGESLADRLDREHQLPVDEAVRITRDVAEALHAAHEKGIIHRDVKPANILLSRGRPLIADFGIAVAVSSAGGGRLTETGLSVGTPYYMSPEQAAADREATAASDIYSLACVLYKMLVGEPPHPGGSAQAILAKVLTEEAPSPAQDRSSVPHHVDAAVRRGLEKLPADRFRTAQDFSKALANRGFRHGAAEEFSVGISGLSNRLSLLMAVGALLLGAAIGRFTSGSEPAPPALVERFVNPFEIDQLPLSSDPGFALSDDGTVLVYRGMGPTGPMLLARRWDDPRADPLQDTDLSWNPSLAPGGDEVVFWDPATAGLRVASLRGGPTRELARTKFSWSHWGRDGYVYLQSDSGAVRIPSEGGALEVVTRSDNENHFVTDVLPDLRTALFWAQLAGGGSELRSVDLTTGETKTLDVGPGSRPTYASSGHLLFVRPDSTLVATEFDLRTREPSSRAVSLVEGVAAYSVAESGKLFYFAPGPARRTTAQFVWMSRSGSVTPADPDWTFEQGNQNFGLSLSPDGDRLAYRDLRDGNFDIWIKELDRGPLSRITFDEARDYMPRWTSDGQRVTFLSRRGDQFDVYVKQADGTGEPELVFSHEVGVMQGFFGPSDEWLLMRTNLPGFLRGDIYAVRLGQESRATPLLAEEFGERSPALSPDGSWLAYTSNETGDYEVYLRPFPDVDSRRWQISTGGGVQPVWSKDGRELFYIDPDRRMVAARVQASGGFDVEDRTVLFQVPEQMVGADLPQSGKYDVSPDGRRFIMARAVAEVDSASFSDDWILVNGFLEELVRAVAN